LRLSSACRALGCKSISVAEATRALLAAGGVSAAVASWCPVSLRVASGGEELLWAMLRAWASLHPLPADKHSKEAAHLRERLLAAGKRGGGDDHSGAAPSFEFEVSSSLQRAKKRRREATAAATDAAAASSSPVAYDSSADVPQRTQGAQSHGEAATRDATASLRGDCGEQRHEQTGGCKFSNTCAFPWKASSISSAPHSAVLRVDINGGGGGGNEAAHYRSVGAAIRDAPTGSTILVAPGLYEEPTPLLLSFSITVQASKGAKLVHIGSGSTIIVDAPASARVVIEGLSIFQRAVAADATAETHGVASASDVAIGGRGADSGEGVEAAAYAVCVRGGRASFTRCVVSAPSSGCVFVTAASTCEFRGCELQHAAAHGGLISGRAKAAFHHCQVHNCKAAGVEARGRASLFVHGCRVNRSGRSGIFVSNFAEAYVEHSNLFSCGFAAVEVAGQGALELTSNRIRQGHRGGVLCLGRSQLLMTDNHVTGNAMAGVTARGSARACLLRNETSGGRASGIYALEEAWVLLLQNSIHDNQLAAVEIESGSRALVRGGRNAIGRNGLDGEKERTGAAVQAVQS
jgi:hypothetical protein